VYDTVFCPSIWLVSSVRTQTPSLGAVIAAVPVDPAGEELRLTLSFLPEHPPTKTAINSKNKTRMRFS
jgi:hypothetical protein